MSVATTKQQQSESRTKPPQVPPAPALTPIPAPAVSSNRLYRLSVEQYNEMIRHGILTKNDRIELLEGLLVNKMGKNPPHFTTTMQIWHALMRSVPDTWLVTKEDPLVLSRSEPEPDVAVIKGRIEDFYQRKPSAQDVALLIEVSHASYPDDRNKRRIYAEAGIPIYWIVHLSARRFEVYTDPTGPDASPDYRNRREYGVNDEVPVILEGQEIARLAVRDLLPPENAPQTEQ